MYEAHFGFSRAPFGLTPDTRFFFTETSHQDALNTLLLALRSGEGFVKLTGEIGLGKTLLCRQLLRTLGQGFVTAYIPNPALTPKALYVAVAGELGFRITPATTQERVLKAIGERLLDNARAGNRTVLVVDEAQAMSDETLEAVRLLTNLETETAKLLQVVLIGQPELDQRLAQPRLRQLRQRISFSARLQPLTRSQFDAYVRHRLEVVGARSPALFSDDALHVLYRASGGTPRLANILCHKALIASFGPGLPAVGAAQALEAVNDTEGTSVSPLTRLLLFAQDNLRTIGLALALSFVLACALSFGTLLGRGG